MGNCLNSNEEKPLASSDTVAVKTPKEVETFLTKKRQQVKVVKKDQITHDTVLLRFGLPNEDMELGMPIGHHIKIWCNNPVGSVEGEWNGKEDPDVGKEEIERKYTPSSENSTKGYFELIVKAYKGGVLEQFPDGGKASQFLDSLEVGDSMDLAGPFGRVTYKGKGAFKVGRQEFADIKQIGLIAGGTGITPMLQMMKAMFADPEDKTKMMLIFANKCEEDILIRDILEGFQADNPDQLEITYTLDSPPEEWTGETGFINAEMIKAHLPEPSDETLIFMCGPPPMIKFACTPNLNELGYPADRQITF